MTKKNLVIFGDSAFAEVAFEYFERQSDYRVVAFTVSREFLQKSTMFGLPIIPFEEIENHYPPENNFMFIALVYQKLNRHRIRFYQEAKEKGYRLASFISPGANVWTNVTIGDNTFIFENNVVQPFAKIGSNVVLWSGNHIGHHSSIGSHCFIASHVVVSGFCNVGDSCFIGVNATIGNNVDVGRDCLIGAGALIVSSIPDGSLLKGAVTSPSSVSTYEKFGVQPYDAL
jgi:sugar O-acyltransferase (sialic acid O-acetyltransferase NeuD family)